MTSIQVVDYSQERIIVQGQLAAFGSIVFFIGILSGAMLYFEGFSHNFFALLIVTGITIFGLAIAVYKKVMEVNFAQKKVYLTTRTLFGSEPPPLAEVGASGRVVIR